MSKESLNENNNSNWAQSLSLDLKQIIKFIRVDTVRDYRFPNVGDANTLLAPELHLPSHFGHWSRSPFCGRGNHTKHRELDLCGPLRYYEQQTWLQWAM